MESVLTFTTSCISWLHISSRFWASTARRSLLWNSFPSKKSQGQHMRKGTGAPQASLASSAISTPCMKRVASWTPRAVTRSSLRRASPSESNSSGEQAVTRKASSSGSRDQFKIYGNSLRGLCFGLSLYKYTAPPPINSTFMGSCRAQRPCFTNYFSISNRLFQIPWG